MAEFEPSIYCVTISATNSSNSYISGIFKIGEYRLRTSFGDPYSVGDVAYARIGIATEMD